MNHENNIFKMHKTLVTGYANLMMNTDIHFEEKLPAGPKILVANHPTTTDPFLLPLLVDEPIYIPVTGMAFEVPLFGKLLHAAGHIPVDKHNPKGSEIIQRAVNKLNDGKTIGIFPEGALSPAIGEFCRARTGAARMALLSNAPVIPVGIHMSENAYIEKEMETDNYAATARFVVRGDYFITLGRAMQFTGGIDDYRYVRTIAEQIMAGIKHQAQKSELRMLEEQNKEKPAFNFPRGLRFGH